METSDPRVPVSLVPPGSCAILIAEHRDGVLPLPSIRTPDGQVITRWTPNAAERSAILRGEDIFVTIRCHGPVNPMFVSIGPVDWNNP